MKSVNTALVALITILVNKYFIPYLFSLSISQKLPIELKSWVVSFVIVPLIVSGIFFLFFCIKSFFIKDEVAS